MMLFLTACSGSVIDGKNSVSNETTATKQETEIAKEEVSTPEPTPELTPEPTPESIVYEGIDYESTEPGVDWIVSFGGIIEEPKLVVFNDDTYKKVIVEEGQKVKFENDDKLAIYIPRGTDGGFDGFVKEPDMVTFNRCTYDLGCTYLETISENYSNQESVVTTNVVKFKDEEITLTATLILKE